MLKSVLHYTDWTGISVQYPLQINFLVYLSNFLILFSSLGQRNRNWIWIWRDYIGKGKRNLFFSYKKK